MRVAIMSGMLVLLSFAGWRISHLMLADAALADGNVISALRWRPDHPDALLKQSEAQLTGKQLDLAAATARHLLRVDPVDGRGFRVLAQVAALEGRQVEALSLFRIAARRAPRDLPSRAWLAQHALEQGDSVAALVQIDQVLTLSPGMGKTIFPVLVTLAADPDFAEALADVLKRPPPWRAAMLAALRKAGTQDGMAAGQVMAALQRQDGFDAAETADWVDALLREGRWGEAYARWATPLVAHATRLPLLFNGDFAQEPTGSGFDWRMPTTPGVILDFEQSQGKGRILHVRFLGRRVAGAYLEHPLMLPPGNYRLRYRARSEALRSDNGVAWTIGCAQAPTGTLATGMRLTGTRGWQVIDLPFTVPATECTGQWLRLGNAGGGVMAGQLVSGDHWLADIVVEGLQAVAQ